MTQTKYHDLAEYNLLLVGSEDATFSSLVSNIAKGDLERAGGDLERAAVLLNQSGKSVVTLAYIWRYTTAEGKTGTNSHLNLGSSTQMEVLCGRAEVTRDLTSFILPGSKRLITEQGMFGNNLDVLPPGYASHGGGGGTGASFRTRSAEETAETELCLDFAIFEDGLCVGPDDSGLFESVTGEVDRQREVAQEILAALRNGASEGEIFETLRPLARRTPHSRLLPMFANMAINRLINATPSELEHWFERIAEPSRIQLHRPT
jgi:hypothetical protein